MKEMDKDTYYNWKNSLSIQIQLISPCPFKKKKRNLVHNKPQQDSLGWAKIINAIGIKPAMVKILKRAVETHTSSLKLGVNLLLMVISDVCLNPKDKEALEGKLNLKIWGVGKG